MSAVKYMWPESRLKTLLTQPGGKSRAEALAGAAECLEECRGLASEGLERSLREIDAVLDGAAGRDLTRDEVYGVLRQAERIASIAVTFDRAALARVAASLGALGDALLDAQERPAHGVAVHARAARWAADNENATEAEGEPVMAGLAKVVARFGGAAPAQPAEA